jgi:DNA repair protein RadA/Sms
MQEEFAAVTASRGLGVAEAVGAQKPIPLDQVVTKDQPRFLTGSAELDQVLGGGLIAGSLILIGGDPGIGKSSLTLQVCAFVARARYTVLYVTGEESLRQVKMRADRLHAVQDNLYVLSETNINEIERVALELQPKLLVIDSIQTMYKPELPSAPGSVSQVREGSAQLMRLAKTRAITTILVGHVTKDGAIAGPRVLEHIVDTVLYFEGDRNAQFRILRAIKNRFGNTNEVGLFEMKDAGLADVPDASMLFLEERAQGVSGSVVIATIEGTRPLLVEMQALVSQAPFMPPRRTANGLDIRRVQLLLAVLEKRAGLRIADADVFVKVAGGIAVEEPAIDLGLALAMASSFRNCAVQADTVVFGEVGLSGEIRAVSMAEQRLREAEKMGFKRAIIPKGNQKNTPSFGLTVVGAATLTQALEEVLSR